MATSPLSDELKDRVIEELIEVEQQKVVEEDAPAAFVGYYTHVDDGILGDMHVE